MGREETRRKFKIVTLDHNDNRNRVRDWVWGGVDLRLNDQVAESPVKYMIVETADQTNMIIGWANPELKRASANYWPAEQGMVTSNAELVRPYDDRFAVLHSAGTTFASSEAQSAG